MIDIFMTYVAMHFYLNFYFQFSIKISVQIEFDISQLGDKLIYLKSLKKITF